MQPTRHANAASTTARPTPTRRVQKVGNLSGRHNYGNTKGKLGKYRWGHFLMGGQLPCGGMTVMVQRKQLNSQRGDGVTDVTVITDINSLLVYFFHNYLKKLVSKMAKCEITMMSSKSRVTTATSLILSSHHQTKNNDPKKLMDEKIRHHSTSSKIHLLVAMAHVTMESEEKSSQ